MKQKNQVNQSKQSKSRDENTPKKAKSAYMFYQKECISRKEKLFGTPENIKNAGGIMKCIGNKWKELDNEQKEKYKQMVEQDKQRHEQQMKDYKNTGTFQGQDEIIRERQLKHSERKSSTEKEAKQVNAKLGRKKCIQ